MIRLLVVDDEIGIRELRRETFEDSGYQVTTASTAAQADVRWAQERPDLVLLDYPLPDVNVLAGEGGNMSQVAQGTGIERTHLYRKFHVLGLRSMRRA